MNDDRNDNRNDDDLQTKGDKSSLKGKLNQAGGTVREKMGELTGNRSQEAKGMGKQLKGHAQEGLGDAERSTDNTLNP